MNYSPIKISVVLLALIFSVACLGEDKPIDDVNTLRPNVNQNENTSININANVADDNDIKLMELINSPYEPIGDSPWREDDLAANADNSGQKGKKITAVLKFSEEDTKKILEKAGSRKNPYKVSIDAESWFPAELIAKSDTTGDTTLKGTGYSADEFVKSPFNEGSLIYIDGTDFFVLNLRSR